MDLNNSRPVELEITKLPSGITKKDSLPRTGGKSQKIRDGEF